MDKIQNLCCRGGKVPFTVGCQPERSDTNDTCLTFCSIKTQEYRRYRCKRVAFEGASLNSRGQTRLICAAQPDPPTHGPSHRDLTPCGEYRPPNISKQAFQRLPNKHHTTATPRGWLRLRLGIYFGIWAPCYGEASCMAPHNCLLPVADRRQTGMCQLKLLLQRAGARM